VPLPVSLVLPFVDGLSLGSGISDNFLLPVPLPEEIVRLPAAFFLSAWIFLNSSPENLRSSISTSIVPVPLPVLIYTLTILFNKSSGIYLILCLKIT